MLRARDTHCQRGQQWNQDVSAKLSLTCDGPNKSVYAHCCIDCALFLPVGIFVNTDLEAENKWIDKRCRTYTGLGVSFLMRGVHFSH